MSENETESAEESKGLTGHSMGAKGQRRYGRGYIGGEKEEVK
jgi:hypothetical protein